MFYELEESPVDSLLTCMSIFDAIITDDSGVCDNCFRQTHDVMVVTNEQKNQLPPILKQATPGERRFPRNDTTSTVYEPFGPVERSTLSVKRICECGQIDSGKNRPLTKRRMIVYTHRLCDRLDAHGIPFDIDILYDTVREMKEDGDNHYKDDVTYCRAIEQAVTSYSSDDKSNPN